MAGWLNKDEAAFIHFGLGPGAGWLRAKGVYDRESSSAFYDHWLARDTAIATGDYAASGPGATGPVTSLRLADEILAEARARLPVQSAPGSDLASLNAALQASDATFAFARGQFADAVIEYNRAVKQFPTLLLVGMFGFRSAATL